MNDEERLRRRRAEAKLARVAERLERYAASA